MAAGGHGGVTNWVISGGGDSDLTWKNWVISGGGEWTSSGEGLGASGWVSRLIATGIRDWSLL